MFGILFANVAAVATGSEMPGLGPFPILQLFGGIFSLIAVGLGLFVYRKVPNSETVAGAPRVNAPSTEIYLGGPYQAILDRLGAIALGQEKLAALHYELRENWAEALRTTRHDLKSALQEVGGGAESDAKDLRRGQEELTRVLGRLDEFLRAKLG